MIDFRFALYQLVLSIVVALVFLLAGAAPQAWSVLAAGGVMAVNWFLLSWSWRRILQKKSIALAASVIVLKYAILGACVFVLLRQPWVENLGLMIGVALTGLAALTQIFFKNKT